MKDVQLDVLKKLMESMGEKSVGRLPKKGSAVLEITMHDHNPEEAGEMEMHDGPEEEFDEKGLDPRLAAIMKKKKGGSGGSGGGSSSGGKVPC